MERIAVYGKGGIGKSVVATTLSAAYARAGRKVLHVGCDPKQDSALRLSELAHIPSVLEVLAKNPQQASTSGILHPGRHGILCCESGGPEPGVGCGGRGVARTLEFLEEIELLQSGQFDVVVFDVLGDVVCGGFAAPLREGFAEKVLIVLSEEPMALFAANNIAKAIRTYQDNGVVLAGFVANLKSATADVERLTHFGEKLSSRLLAVVPRDEQVIEAERARLTVIEHAPEAPAARALLGLADAVVAVDVAGARVPTPLSDDEFFAFVGAGG